MMGLPLEREEPGVVRYDRVRCGQSAQYMPISVAGLPSGSHEILSMERSITTMLSRTADGAMLVDEQGTVVFWNKAAERLLGFSKTDVIGRPCHEVMRGETLSGQPFCSFSCAVGHRLGCGNGVRNFDIQIHTKAGKVIWLNVSSLPVP